MGAENRVTCHTWNLKPDCCTHTSFLDLSEKPDASLILSCLDYALHPSMTHLSVTHRVWDLPNFTNLRDKNPEPNI